jgi:transposase
MHLTKERPSPKMDPWKPVIDQWLAEDETRPRKQRRTARKIYRDLVSAFSADVSEVTVRRYVRSRKQGRAREAYVPLEFPMGSMAEADFGHALVTMGDVDRTVPFFALRLMAGGVSFVKAYPHEKLEAMLDGIASGLGFLGGVPRQLMFDYVPRHIIQVMCLFALCAGGPRHVTADTGRRPISPVGGHITVRATRASS